PREVFRPANRSINRYGAGLRTLRRRGRRGRWRRTTGRNQPNAARVCLGWMPPPEHVTPRGLRRSRVLPSLALAATLAASILTGCGRGEAIRAASTSSARPETPSTPQVRTSPRRRPTHTPAPEQPAPSPLDTTMLVWTPGGLPTGFAGRVASVPGVDRSVVVAGGTVWLTRSWSDTGKTADDPPAGMAVRIDLAGAA